MASPLAPASAALLTLAPLLWAGNALVGRLVRDAVPPMTLNLLRWSIVLLILLPLGWRVFRPGGALLGNWRRYGLLGLFGFGLYNSFQYLALHSSTPLNVTLVAGAMPLWMLLVGRIGFQAPVSTRQASGAALSMAGVLVVLCRGQWDGLAALRLVPGDAYMIAASIAWSLYSWLLTLPKDPPQVRTDWAAFMLAQVIYGVLWSGLLSGAEWAQGPHAIAWSWPLAAALLFVAIGPGIIAFRCWSAGVARAGPATAAFFINLTPLFAALLSAAFLGELPQPFHGAAFALIVAGIVCSARR